MFGNGWDNSLSGHLLYFTFRGMVQIEMPFPYFLLLCGRFGFRLGYWIVQGVDVVCLPPRFYDLLYMGVTDVAGGIATCALCAWFTAWLCSCTVSFLHIFICPCVCFVSLVL